MNTTDIKRTAAFAAVAAAFCAAQFGCQSQADAAPNPKDYFKPDIQYVDGTNTFNGPARGYAAGGWTVFKPEGLPKWKGAKAYNSSLWELSKFSGGRVQGKHSVPTNRVGGADILLTDAMKADVRRYLEETRQNGGSLIVRLGYTWSDSQGCEPNDFDIVLGHVRDLSKIMADYDDVIVGVEAGIAGPWAEMHSSDYCKKEYMNRILKTYCDNLGGRISILVRTAYYLDAFAETNTVGTLAMLPFQDKDLKRFGMYNDGYLGTWWDYGTWSGKWKRELGCQLLDSICRDNPYGGELAYVSMDWLEKNREKSGDLLDIEKWNIVKDWYQEHLNYLRNIGDRKHSLCAFIAKKTFSSDVYRFEGMPDLHEYDGVDLHKFMYDHMGYRFVVRDARLPKKMSPGKAAMIGLKVENTGFGRLLLPSRAEVVFVSGGETFTAPVDGLKDGISSLLGAQTLSLPLRFTMPKEMKAGEYDLYLRFSAPLKDEAPGAVPRRPICFANAGMWNDELKANAFGKVSVK